MSDRNEQQRHSGMTAGELDISRAQRGTEGPTLSSQSGTPGSLAYASPPPGIERFLIYDAPSSDLPGGPTEQPGVMPGPEHDPLRTQFGATGVPGAGHERNVTDLDLTHNQHADGFPFADAAGRDSLEPPWPVGSVR